MADGPALRQRAGNAIPANLTTPTCRVSFDTPTVPGNLIVIVALASAGTAALTAPAGFVPIRMQDNVEMTLAAWYYENAPGTSSVQVATTTPYRSLSVQVLEVSGIAQGGSLDQVSLRFGADNIPRTGVTGVTNSDDEFVVAAVANQYASSWQFAFTGGLARILEAITPVYVGILELLANLFGDLDRSRSRLSVHTGLLPSPQTFELTGQLSTYRRWIAIAMTFRSTVTGGPVYLHSRPDAPILQTPSRVAQLNISGRFTSTAAPAISSSALPVLAHVGPFNYQYRLNGLLIGNDTPYTVENHDGLEGWNMRTSDDDLPHGDGALRGVDLQSARQILFEIKVGGDVYEVERLVRALYQALQPRRDQDWELIWRHPGRPMRMLRARPTDMTRTLDYQQVFVNNQKIALRAADPRHYSARQQGVRFQPADGQVTITNEGSANAYPIIRVSNPVLARDVTRVQITNVTESVDFALNTVLPGGAELTVDMEARVTGANRSVVTIDGQSKYGAWEHPRNTLYLAPGDNKIAITTVPAGVPVVCTFAYRDTWAG